MKGAIIYKSKYGSTSDYAQMLQRALYIPAMEVGEADSNRLKAFDFLLLGSPVYNGQLLLQKWIWQNRHVLETKRLFYFIVCATPAEDKEATTNILSGNIPGVLQTGNPIVFLGGRINRPQLSFTDRMMLRIKTIATKDPVRKKILLEGMDRVHRQQLEPLIGAVELYADPLSFPVG